MPKNHKNTNFYQDLVNNTIFEKKEKTRNQYVLKQEKQKHYDNKKNFRNQCSEEIGKQTNRHNANSKGQNNYSSQQQQEYQYNEQYYSDQQYSSNSQYDEQYTVIKKNHYSRSKQNQRQYQDFDQQHFSPKTKYPQTRKSCAQLFRRRYQNGQKTYNIEESDKILQKYVEQMDQYGYQIDFQDIQYRKGRKPRTMRRKVKLQYQCTKCNKRFTSLVGLFEVIFKFQRGEKDDSLLLQFQCKMYEMQCQKCHIQCAAKIFQSQMEAVGRSFCLILAQIIQEVPLQIHADKRHKINDDVHFHKSQLCAACKEGICYARPKGETNIQQSRSK